MKALMCVRGGSKGIPKKNIAKFHKSNLLSYSIQKIKSNNNIEKIYVSTDSKEISNIALKENVTVIERPRELATDETNEIEVWKHFCKSLAIEKDEPFLVTPVTSPLRENQDIDKALKLWQTKNYDIIMSRKKSSRNPYLSMVTENNNGDMKPLNYQKKIYRRQDAPIFYDILGVLYLTTFEYILSKDSLLSGRVGWIDIPEERSIDIDTPWDLQLANLIVNSKNYS